MCFFNSFPLFYFIIFYFNTFFIIFPFTTGKFTPSQHNLFWIKWKEYFNFRYKVKHMSENTQQHRQQPDTGKTIILIENGNMGKKSWWNSWKLFLTFFLLFGGISLSRKNSGTTRFGTVFQIFIYFLLIHSKSFITNQEQNSLEPFTLFKFFQLYTIKMQRSTNWNKILKISFTFIGKCSKEKAKTMLQCGKCCVSRVVLFIVPQLITVACGLGKREMLRSWKWVRGEFYRNFQPFDYITDSVSLTEGFEASDNASQMKYQEFRMKWTNCDLTIFK